MKPPKNLLGMMTFHVSPETFSQPFTFSEPVIVTFSPGAA
jgi:hypothetical protein